MYTADEVWMLNDNWDIVYHRVLLPIDDNKDHGVETVTVELTLTVPADYLSLDSSDSLLKIEAKLAATDQHANNDTAARKVVFNVLPRLVTACSRESRARCGKEAIVGILNAAKILVQNDWRTILQKQLLGIKDEIVSGASCNTNTNRSNQSSRKRSNGKRGLVMSRLLLETHHTTDPNKIKLVKDLTSRYNLGCCIKIGRPGLVLIEGLKENCSACASELMKNRTKQRAMRDSKKAGKDTATFAIRGSVTSSGKIENGSELENSRILPLEFEILDSSKIKISGFHRLYRKKSCYHLLLVCCL